MQLRMKNGQLVQRQYPHNPFTGNVQQEAKTQDEQDYDSYLADMREKLDDPYYDPIQVTEE